METRFFQKLKGEVIIENIPNEKTEQLGELINIFEKKYLENNFKNPVISLDFIARGMLRILTEKDTTAKKLAKIIKKEFKGKISFTKCRQEACLRAKITLL